MSADRRTLTDELNSVLIEHSLDAPQPGSSIDAVLSRVAPLSIPAGGPRRRRARWPRQLNGWLVAAGVLGLCGTGVVALGSHSSDSKSSSTAGDAKAAPGFASSAASGGAAAVPSATGTGSSAQRCVPVAEAPKILTLVGATYTVVQSYCPVEQASQVQVSAHENAQARVVSTLVSAEQHLLVQSITVDGGRLTITALQVANGSFSSSAAQATAQDKTALGGGPVQPGGVEALTFVTSDGTHFATALPRLVTPACAAAQLALGVSAVHPPAPLPARVTVTNHSSAECAISGYPSFAITATSASLAFAQTLSGPAGGVRNQAHPPIVVLSPGSAATALVERYPGQPIHPPQTCTPTSTLRVSLDPVGVLAAVDYSLGACDFTVHPFVAGSSGNAG